MKTPLPVPSTEGQAIIVVGAGGSSKAAFLSRLASMGADVLVIDTTSSRLAMYPTGVRYVLVDRIDRHELKRIIEDLPSLQTSTVVTSLFEPCVDAAAWLREACGWPGLSLEETMLFRDKVRMYEFVRRRSITSPAYLTLSALKQNSQVALRPPYVLKPTMGFGNLGVRRLDHIKALDEALHDASEDLAQHPWRDVEFTSVGTDWLLTEYIAGKEVEVDLVVYRGAVMFRGVQEKTVIHSYGFHVEENNAITPHATLSPVEERKLVVACERIATETFAESFRPHGIDWFTLYVEFRIADDGTPFCLEMAARIGGGFGPEALRRSTGIDLFDVAAHCALRREPDLLRNAGIPRAVYWQLVYSQCRGTLLEVKGLSQIPSDCILFFRESGYEIRAPQSDAIAGFMFEAPTVSEACAVAAQRLAEIRVLVRDSVGNEQLCAVPLGSSRYRAAG